MSALLVRRRHQLARIDAEQRLERIADKMTERFGAVCTKSGAVITVEHRDVNGTITIADTEVVIEARLGGALGLFKRRVESEIERILDRELG
jgi:putative polyhydroxyalkanoate system protein